MSILYSTTERPSSHAQTASARQSATFAPMPPTGSRHGQRLAKFAVLARQLNWHETIVIQVAHGAAWITLEGDTSDYTVEAGQSLTLTGPGRLVIEGLQLENTVVLGTLG